MSIRSELRVTEWCPKFAWVSSIEEVAESINRPHEDYPHRVQATVSEIERLSKLHLPDTIPNLLLLEIHRAVFWDEDFKGQWKEIDVVVSPDHAPRITRVADWMQRLESEYEGKALDVGALREWHLDFETIHPFPDGNGRTGGIIVAAYSHQLAPEKGWFGSLE